MEREIRASAVVGAGSAMAHLRATVYRPEGGVEHLILPESLNERLRVLQALVGGYLEVVSLPGRNYLVLNEDAKEGDHLHNLAATRLARQGRSITAGDYIAGCAILVTAQALA